MFVLLVAVVSFLVTAATTPVLIRKFKDAGITGEDRNKRGHPPIPEMGGLAIVAGLVAGILLAVALSTLAARAGIGEPIVEFKNLDVLFAALGTILIIAIVGIFDDLVRLRQSVKALLPLIASLPLVAVAAGHPTIFIPFIGKVYLPYIYPLLLIPLGVTVASNLTNMLAGFNGLEAGMGLAACSGLAVVAWQLGKPEALVIMLGMMGSLLAFLIFNWYPAKVFPGDVGTLTIGVSIAAAVIIGNFEMAGVVVLLPYLADFVIKAKNRFPKEVLSTKLRGSRLTCPQILGLPSLLMNIFNGLRERTLVLTLIGIEVIFAAVATLVW